MLGELPARFYTDAPVAGVWYADLARAELALGENADEAMEGLRGIIALSGGKAALRKNLQESLSLLEARRDAAAGQPVDWEQLEEQLNRAGYKLRSLELLQVLAMDARNRGDKAKCGAWLARMRQESGKTAFRKWAAEWNA